MLMSVVSGLVVSVDAFFIGVSLGLQKQCKFLHLAIINAFLFGLCMLGFFIAGQVYEHIPFDPDWVVGFAFIALGLWCVLQYFLPKREEKTSLKSIALVGLVMSSEAMLITIGIVFIFQIHATLLIPIIVALAHFAYSALSFYLARTKHVKRIPVVASHIVSGLALVIYGLMALFVEIAI